MPPAAQIVVTEHGPLLEGSGCENNPRCAQFIEAAALHDGEPIVGKYAFAACRGEHGDVGKSLKARHKRSALFSRPHAAGIVSRVIEGAAPRRIVVHDDDAAPFLRRCDGGAQPGGPAAYDRDIGKEISLVVIIMTRPGIDAPKPGHSAD